MHRLKQCHSPAESSPYTATASSNQVLREYWKYSGLLFKIVPLCIIDSGSSDSCILRELKTIHLASEDGLFLSLNKIPCDYEVF